MSESSLFCDGSVKKNYAGERVMAGYDGVGYWGNLQGGVCWPLFINGVRFVDRGFVSLGVGDVGGYFGTGERAGDML